MVPDLIWAPAFFGSQEIWSPRSLGPAWKSHVMIFMQDSNFLGTISQGPKKSAAQMRLGTISVKVRTFWATHKVWKNLPHGFEKSADLLSKRQNHDEDFFSNYVCFSKSPNFTAQQTIKIIKKNCAKSGIVLIEIVLFGYPLYNLGLLKGVHPIIFVSNIFPNSSQF